MQSLAVSKQKPVTRIRILLWLVLLWFLSSLGCTLCENEIRDALPSPDGKRTAATVVRDCGATTSESMGVYVRDAGQKSFRPQDVVFAVNRTQRIEVAWQNNNELMIDCRGCRSEEITKKLSILGPIKITYRND